MFMTKLMRTVMLTVMLMLRVSAFALDPVKYLDENGQEQWVTDYTEIDIPYPWVQDYEYDFGLKDGWYVVKKSFVGVQQTVLRGGHAHVIICDNCVFDMYEFMVLSGSIHIYSQSFGENMGVMNIHDVVDYKLFSTFAVNGGNVNFLTTFRSKDPNILCYTFTMNGGNLFFGTDEYGRKYKFESLIRCSEMYLNGGTISTDRTDVFAVANNHLEFGHSSCNFVGDFVKLFYYGDDDIKIYDGLTVKLNDKEYVGSIPYDITDYETISHVEAAYDDVVGIEQNDISEDNDDRWFTLDGVCLVSKPSTSGMYIHGKKKVYVK